jgi:hypothetical protein
LFLSLKRSSIEGKSQPMKKKLLLPVVLSFILFPFISWSAPGPPDYDTLYANEFGFNATALIKMALPFNKLELISFYPYDFSFKHLKKNKKKFYRLGISFRSKGVVNIFSIFPQDASFRFAIRSGNERHRMINKHWCFINGSDFRTGFALNRTGIEFSSQLFAGYAYTGGLEYRFMDRFRIYTEAAFLITIHTTGTDNFLTVVPEFGNSVFSGASLEINMPTFINLSYAF